MPSTLIPLGRLGAVAPVVARSEDPGWNVGAHAHPVVAHGAGRTRVSIPTSSVGTRLPGEKYQ